MPSLKIAGVDVENVQVGSTEVQAIYVGSNKVWENSLSRHTLVAGTHTYSNSYNDQGGSVTTTDYRYKGFNNLINGSSFSPGYTLHGGTAINFASFYTYRRETYNSQTPSNITVTQYSILSLWGQVANSGWTSITVNGNTKNRADATFTLGSYGNCWWEWSDSTWIPGSGTHDVVFK
jgi:hypothetical protein